MSVSNMLAADSAAVQSSLHPDSARNYFFVTGLTDHDLLARVLCTFSKTGLTPYRIYASSEHGTGGEMTIELRIAGLEADQAERLAAKCRSIIGVQTVLMVSGQ
jgi:hypothetical protein